MSEFHFLRPLWFLALIPAVWLLVVLWRRQSSGTAWHSVFDQQLLAHLWLEKPGRSARLPWVLLMIGWLLTVCLLAGPVWERQPEPVWHAQQSRVIILDLSPSMNARDLAPSRLERARFKITDILSRSREGRTGLVVFAGEPHIVTPLTEDIKTIENLVSALYTDIMPVSGDDAAPALQMAAELLNLKGVRKGELLLITDGIADPAAALEQVRALRAKGHTLSVLGIGTELGGAIIQDGVTEVIRFDPAPLQELARAGDGVFSRLTHDDQDLNRLLPAASATSDFDRVRSDTGGVDRWVEYGVWLLPIILLLAAAGFRRGWLMGCVVFIMTPPPTYAFNWQDLWSRADQQAHEQLQQGDPQAAAQQFQDSNWRGMALYEAGEFAAAAQAFAQSDNLDARYNRGNALARAGDFEQAMDAYRSVLQENPSHEDAHANLKLLEQLLEDQQQQGDGNDNSDENAKQNDADDQQESASNDEADKEANDNTDTHADENSAQQGLLEPENDDYGNEEENTERAATNENQSDEQLQDAERPEQQPGQAQDMQQHEQENSGQDLLAQENLQDEENSQPSEEDIALEQWLRQIPEDPSGLLRRKFMLEHQLRKYQ